MPQEPESSLDAPLVDLRPFRVQRIDIADFRGLRDVQLVFPESGPTVIVGVNGAGKSTILQGIYRSLTWVTSRLKNVKANGVGIRQDEINNAAKSVSLKLNLAVHKGSFDYIIAATREGYPKLIATNTKFLNDVVKEWQSGNAVENRIRELPLVYYYEVDRSITDIPTKIHKRKDDSRFSVYSKRRESFSLDFRDFVAWYKQRQSVTDQEGVIDDQLRLVNAAIDAVVPGYHNPRIIQRTNKFLLTDEHGEEFNISQLSDGERTLITLVADIAKRGAIALEGNESMALSDIFGVVLIDEIELHLHPQWQHTIVGRLQDTFPNLQFIFTTHSPAILTNVPDENSFLLDKGKLYNPDTYGKTANALLEQVFETDASAPAIQQRFAEMNQLIGAQRFEEARDKLNALRKELPDDPRVAEADVLLWRPER